ncbi:hypothetical protein BCAR13_440021 [Paraburkholderia caribensis]|nr:hypothetical protein BCAR13_440021 [Paraburkholderia caribensis]
MNALRQNIAMTGGFIAGLAGALTLRVRAEKYKSVERCVHRNPRLRFGGILRRLRELYPLGAIWLKVQHANHSGRGQLRLHLSVVLDRTT